MASSTAIMPVERLVMILMESMGSSLLPPITRSLLPWKKFLDSTLNVQATTSSLDATLARTPSLRGPMRDTPQEDSFSRLAFTAGFVNMESCIAGAIAIGIPDPIATVAIEVTGVSSMPLAIFDIVFAVAG